MSDVFPTAPERDTAHETCSWPRPFIVGRGEAGSGFLLMSKSYKSQVFITGWFHKCKRGFTHSLTTHCHRSHLCPQSLLLWEIRFLFQKNTTNIHSLSVGNRLVHAFSQDNTRALRPSLSGYKRLGKHMLT